MLSLETELIHCFSRFAESYLAQLCGCFISPTFVVKSKGGTPFILYLWPARFFIFKSHDLITRAAVKDTMEALFFVGVF